MRLAEKLDWKGLSGSNTEFAYKAHFMKVCNILQVVPLRQ
jgi:hypothetical protein